MVPTMSRLLQMAAVWAAVSGIVHADDFDKYRTACEPQQLTTIQNALTKAKALLTKASSVLPANNSTVGLTFRKWFGGTEGDNDPTVAAVYAEALGFLGFKAFWCPNASFPKDDPGTFAFVPKGVAPFGEVFIEAAFFKANARGADSQAGSIVHEVVHLSTKRAIGDLAYGTNDAKNLAKTDPQKARRNADNFEYFAEDLVDGIP